MKLLRSIFLLVAPAILLYACGSSKKAIKEYTVLDTVTVKSSNSIYRASPPRYWDITHTRARLSFNWAEKTADGEVWLQIHPYFYAADTLWLDAKSMEISEVTLDGHKKVAYQYQDDKLKIQFDRFYQRTDTITIHIKYKAMPYAEASGGSAAITEDRGLYFINTDYKIPGKPAQIWTQGETESNSHWLPTLDQPNERFTAEISLMVPDSFVSLGNGVLAHSEKKGNGLREDTWKIDKPIQTYAVMFAIGKFSVVKDRNANGKPVEYYVEQAFAPYARKIFNNTPEMIDYFSQITGVPYPWDKYSQIIVRDYVSGAMENTTASLFGEFMNQDAREIADDNYEDIVSHELFHQWFGDYVTAESWSNLTLNESFANYGEQLWRLHKYGRASNDELAYGDLYKYINASAYGDPDLVRYYYHDREDMFDRISYEKGGAILHYLHGLTGDTAFYKAMQIYLTKNALQSAEAANWRMAVEDATGLDWNWFFNQWYFRAGHPVLRLAYEYNDDRGELTVHVRQMQSDSGYIYKLPLKAALGYNGNMQVVDWNIQKRRQDFTFKYVNGNRPVFIPDVTHWLVGEIKDMKKPEEWLRQYQSTGDDYINKRKAIAGAFQVSNDSFSQVIFHEALKDKLPNIRAYALILLERMPDKYNWHEHFRSEVEMLSINDGNNKVRAAAFSVAGKWKLDHLQSRMKEAINDSSYAVAGAALGALRDIDKDTAYVWAKKILNNNLRGDLREQVWGTIAYKGNTEDFSYFQNHAHDVYGRDKISFATYLQLYSLYNDDDDLFAQCMQLIAQLAQSESIKSYRYAIGSNVFDAYEYYKKSQKSTTDSEKVTAAKKRAAIADRYKRLIIKEETDPAIVKQYESYNGD